MRVRLWRCPATECAEAEPILENSGDAETYCPNCGHFRVFEPIDFATLPSVAAMSATKKALRFLANETEYDEVEIAASAALAEIEEAWKP